MMKLSWLAVVGLPVFISGCEFEKPRACPDPGGITNESCFYTLTITKPSPEPDLAIGQVPMKIIEDNSRRRMWGDIWADFDPKTYPHFEYAFHIKDANNLKINSTYDFLNELGTYYLKLCDIDCRVKRIKKEYPDKSDDEIKRCLTENKCWMW
jgi:hypothetical protein